MKKYSLIILAAFLALTASCSSSDDSSPVDKPIIENPTKPNPKPEPAPESNKGFNYIPVDKDQQAYYKGVDFRKRGDDLQKDLHDLVERTHNQLNYTPDIWRASEITDVNPDNPNEVILIYGWPINREKNIITKRTMDMEMRNHKGYDDDRRKNYWEREHVFAKSLATPKLVTNTSDKNYDYKKPEGLIAGVDAHNLRPINGEWNQQRFNTKFAEGNGNSGNQNSGWFPGEEWKGDVARMMMYMYLRYGDQCAPNKVGLGSPVVDLITGKKDMLRIFIKWNAEDPVSEIERKRNDYHGNPNNQYSQGNRNPFIDNPHLANLIWGVHSEKNLNAQNIWTEVKPEQK